MSESGEEDVSAVGEWQVTGDWLEGILVSYHREVDKTTDVAVSVANFSVSPGCDSGDSVLSDILAVKLDYRITPGAAEDKTLSLIIKLLPRDPFSRFFVTEAQFDLREIRFYTQVVPELVAFQTQHLAANCAPIQVPIPRCYHARYVAPTIKPNASPTPGESVLVLENLKGRLYHGADFSAGLTLRQTASALHAVARLHALSLALKIKEGRPLADRYPFLFQTSKATDSYQQLVERGLPQLARFLERRPGLEKVLECLVALRPNTKDLIASLLAPEEPIALITHTDFWCNNLLFRDEDDECECAVLDWQMVTYSRPTNDVALLMISSVSAELRREHTDALLDGYWKAFTGTAAMLDVDVEHGLGYTRPMLDDDYRRSQLLAMLLCIGSVDVALGDPLTEQRLVDALQDLHEQGILSMEITKP